MNRCSTGRRAGVRSTGERGGQGDPEALREDLLANVPEIRLATQEGAISDLTVEVFPPAGLERLERTGKIIHFLDRRPDRPAH